MKKLLITALICFGLTQVGWSQCGQINTLLNCATKPTQIQNFYSGTMGSTVNGTINFGDGITVPINTQGTMVHTYQTPGTYTIAINANYYDNNVLTCSGITTKTVTIPSCVEFGCRNFDFESNFTNWKFTTRQNGCQANDITCIQDGPITGDHTLLSSGTDPYGGFPISPSGANKVLKLGNDNNDQKKYTARFSYKGAPEIIPNDEQLAFHFAAVIETPPQGATNIVSPFINIHTTYEEFDTNDTKCTIINITEQISSQYLIKSGNVYYQPWTTHFVKLPDGQLNGTFEVIYEVTKGSYVGTDGIAHTLFAQAYFDGYCAPPEILATDQVCVNTPLQFTPAIDVGFNGNTAEFLWDMGDGTQYTTKSITHTYTTPGQYTVTLGYNPSLYNTLGQGSSNLPPTDGGIIINPNLIPDFDPSIFGNNPPSLPYRCGGTTLTQQITVNACTSTPFTCETCIPQFSPLPGEKYILNAWAKQGDGIGYSTYTAPVLKINFMQGSASSDFKPSGLIIDGWQRIEGEFIVPGNAEQIWIELKNESATEEVFFDDIRVQPFNSSVKSFVYDPVTLRFAAELDERNYATFYEYDEEGGLVRVKKETERGVKTITESRTSIKKQK